MQSCQKSYADPKRCELEFQVGDYISRFGVKSKLAPRFIGPFEVTKRIGNITYCLNLPPKLGCVHNVFHVSVLSKYAVDSTHVIKWTKIPIKEDITYEEQPVKILGREFRVLHNKEIPLVKVLWKHHKENKLLENLRVRCIRSTRICFTFSSRFYFEISGRNFFKEVRL